MSFWREVWSVLAWAHTFCWHMLTHSAPKRGPYRFTSEELQVYWRDVFPYERLANALFGGSGLVYQRLAAFDGHMKPRGVHGHYETPQEWREAVLDAGDVARIDVGARCASDMRTPLSMPLVFDLDFDDCANVHIGPTLPSKTRGLDESAWRHITLSAALLDAFVRIYVAEEEHDDEQPTPHFAVYSGRRGLHVWYPQLVRDWTSADDCLALSTALDRLTTPVYAASFVAHLERVGAHTEELRNAVIDFATEALAQDSRLWTRFPAKHPAFHYFEDVARQWASRPVRMMLASKLLTAGVLLLAPRIDAAVTNSLTHLIKAPFSVHPATGHVCIPFSLRPVANLPRLGQVVRPVGRLDATDVARLCDAHLPPVTT